MPSSPAVGAGRQAPRAGLPAGRLLVGAATTRAHGAGRITVVGTVPGTSFAAALLAWAAPTPRHGWSALPDDVRVTTASREDGRRLMFVHHWGWGQVDLPAPRPLTDVLDPATRFAGGAPVHLGPWDVRVLVTDEEGPA